VPPSFTRLYQDCDLRTADLEETEFGTEIRRLPKRLRHIAVRSASLPTAAVGALNGKHGGNASGRCCVRSLEEELEGCRLTVNTLTL
jgi:hypothetical protein